MWCSRRQRGWLRERQERRDVWSWDLPFCCGDVTDKALERFPPPRSRVCQRRAARPTQLNRRTAPAWRKAEKNAQAVPHLTQEALGTKVGLTAQQISKYERGESSISVELFERIEKITDDLSDENSSTLLDYSFGFSERQALYASPHPIKSETLAILQQAIDDLNLGMERLRKL
ncbi:MAG TPA: helix-turn-helix transcriptional regulator [Tianweitania sediminis]|nr:helix-turn-helix transcriptional regulator [Tianweitania sediminis]